MNKMFYDIEKFKQKNREMSKFHEFFLINLLTFATICASVLHYI